MPWIVKLDKDDFVGKWALEHVQERGFREQLVGFEMDGRRRAGRGRPGRASTASPPGASRARAGARSSGRAIGMAWVPPELAPRAHEIEISVDGGARERAAVRLKPFFDPEGSGSAS